MGGPPLADAGKRFLARLLDGVIVTIISLVFTIPIYIAMFNNMREQMEQSLAAGTPATPSPFANFGLQFALGAAWYVVYFLYDWLMHSFAGGQTVGKKAVKTRVVRLDGAPLSAGGVAARSAVFALPPIIYCLGSIFWLVNVLSLLWNKPYQQCYHDKAAKTIVIQAG